MCAGRWRNAPAHHSPCDHSAAEALCADLNLRSNGTGLCAKVAAIRNTLRASPEDGASAGDPPEVHHSLSPTGLLRTTSSCWWAALAGIPAAPILLGRTPPCHPIGKACVAIIGRAGDADRSATSSLPWAALSMHPAAPLFFSHRPSHHPIGEAISAIVWVSRSGWHDGCWWHERHRHRHRHWRRSDWARATNMVNPAAPRLLVRLPTFCCPHCAIEGVDWTDWPRRLCRTRRRRLWRWRWGRERRRWRWCWRRSGLRSGWHLSGATDATGAAAVLLLLW